MKIEFNGKKAVLLEDTRVLGFWISAGFEFNGANIPAFLWSVLFVHPFHHRVIKAALLHDWFYSGEISVDRAVADYLFMVSLKHDGCNWIRRKAMYYGVRLFGGSYWDSGHN